MRAITRFSLPRRLARPRGAHSERGQGLVEFALIGPTVFLVLFLLIEGALYINAQATIDNAGREAARVAAMCGGSIAPSVTYNGVSSSPGCAAAVQSATTTHLGLLRVAAANVNPNVLLCSPPPASGPCTSGNYQPTQGSLIQVTVIYHYDYYFGTILNQAPFKTDIESDAIVVSQQ